jgi:hypothetical protein
MEFQREFFYEYVEIRSTGPGLSHYAGVRVYGLYLTNNPVLSVSSRRYLPDRKVAKSLCSFFKKNIILQIQARPLLEFRSLWDQDKNGLC